MGCGGSERGMGEVPPDGSGDGALELSSILRFLYGPRLFPPAPNPRQWSWRSSINMKYSLGVLDAVGVDSFGRSCRTIKLSIEAIA